jgi:hypothetical protein
LLTAIAGISGNPNVTGIPLGTVTPVPTVGDPYDIFLTYRNFGTVDLWGSDLGATFLATDRLSFTATYSFVNENLFRNQGGIADIALNAPMNKATLSANYRDPRAGLSAELRGRYVDRFPMNSGVYVRRRLLHAPGRESPTLFRSSVRPRRRSRERILDDRRLGSSTSLGRWSSLGLGRALARRSAKGSGGPRPHPPASTVQCSPSENTRGCRRPRTTHG